MKIEKQKLQIIAPFLILLAIIASYYFWHQKNNTNDPLDKMTLNQAAREGQMVEMKLLVQIETPQGRADDANARLERGDVVLAKPADWQFSDAEKSGFLIIKVKVTPALADLMVKPVEKIIDTEKDTGAPIKETERRRKFAVDLNKIGIGKDDEKGREIADKTFDWHILIQK
jgi:hypothetical protein